MKLRAVLMMLMLCMVVILSIGINKTQSNEVTYDIVVTNVAPNKNVVFQGFPLMVNVTVLNQGNFTETFNVTLYANTISIASQTVTLTSGNSTTVTFMWDTTGVPYGDYTISAYAHPLPGETNTDDNTYVDGTVSITFPGDVDFDGYVDSDDFYLFAGAYGTSPPSNPDCDLDRDGYVDSDDFYIFSGKYGQRLKVGLKVRYPEGYDCYPPPTYDLVVIVDIEAPKLWDNTEHGIVGWVFDMEIDPAVLEPYKCYGDPSPGCYLTDFLEYHWYEQTADLLYSIETWGFSGVASMILGWGDLGVGAGGSSGPNEMYGTDYGLVRLRYKVLESAYSSIEITNAYYYTVDGKYAFDYIECGCYSPCC